MGDHKQDSIKGLCSGLALGVVDDLRPKNKFKFLQNIRTLVEGVLESRTKVDSFLTLNYGGPNPNDVPHTLKTIINKGNNSVNRLVGIGDKLFSGSGAVLLIKDSGYSTVPLTIVDFRPEEATESYAYIGDKLKMRKISVSDLLSEIGLNAPTKAATFKIVQPNRTIVDNITTAGIGSWNNLTGSAGVPTAVTRVNTTVTKCLLDDPAAPCFASIIPNDLTAEFQNGEILIMNAVDTVIVEEVCPIALTTGTVTKISYDAGANGLATIVLSISSPDLKRNSVLYLNSAEYVRVLEVTRDANNIPSVRVKTVGTIANGQTAVGVPSFRIYAPNNYVSPNAIFAEYLKTDLGAAGVSSITKTVNIDLTTANGKPLSDDDILHLSLQAIDGAKITEIQIQLGYDSVFTDDYYYFVVTPNFFVSSTLQSGSTLATIQESLQRQELLGRLLTKFGETGVGDFAGGDFHRDPSFVPNSVDTFIEPPVIQTTLGANQWTELFIRIGDFIRSGVDPTKTKRNITTIRISINTTAATSILLDSIWLGGGSTLDTKGEAKFLKYNWIWRVRDNVTKNPSNWSPPLREGVETNRTNVSLTPTGASVDYPANFLIDFARFGGTLNDFRIVGTIKNDGSAFLDTVSDRTAAQNPPAGRKLTGDAVGDNEVFDFYKPFTYLDTPKIGTCDVIGTKFIWKTLDKLNVTYPRGVGITINGIFNQFYTNPTDDQHVELEKDMGNLADVAFEIQAPLLTGQAIPILFGPWGEGSSGLIIFGLKAIDGILFWLDGNSPDTMSDLNFLEITSPSEPLLAGVIYDAYAFVLSSRRSFTLYPTYQSGGLGFIARENANSRGVLGSYCVCAGRDFIYQVTENGDGIVRSQGSGNPQNITDGTLYNLFRHDGVNPQPITLVDGTIVYPPDFAFPNGIRLFYAKDHVYFRYADTDPAGAKEVAFVFDERIGDWISYDVYLDNKANVFYHEETANGSNLLIGIKGGVGKFEGLTNREDAITSILLPFASDQGDSNLLKQYNEIVIDIDKGETDGFNCKNIYNNGIESDAAFQRIGAVGSKREKIIKNIDKLARNITSRFLWTLRSKVKFYEEQIYFLPREDEITQRPSDTNDGGFFGEKFWQGITIEADTFGQDKVLKFYTDDDLVNPAAQIIINTTGKETVSRSFDQPFIAHSVVRKSGDDVNWIFYKEKYTVDKEPELAMVWEGQETTFDIPGFKVIKRQAIAYRSTQTVKMIWTYDGLVDEEYILPSTAGARGKFFFFLRARKGKVLRPRLESVEGFRLYRKDCEAWVRGVFSPNDYRTVLPFGQDHRETEVRI